MLDWRKMALAHKKEKKAIKMKIQRETAERLGEILGCILCNSCKMKIKNYKVKDIDKLEVLLRNYNAL